MFDNRIIAILFIPHVIARLQGNEFVILLPETEAESVFTVAHKLSV